MIRVGGGFMSIDEFVDRHAEKECNNFKIRMKKDKKEAAEII